MRGEAGTEIRPGKKGEAYEKRGEKDLLFMWKEFEKKREEIGRPRGDIEERRRKEGLRAGERKGGKGYSTIKKTKFLQGEGLIQPEA